MRRRFIPALLLATLAACGGVVDPSNNQNESFSGTIQFQGAGPLHTFNVSKSGEISVVVNSLTPTVASGTLFEVVYGQVVSGQCATININQFAVAGATIVSGAIVPGQYCIQLVDEGFFKQNENYTMTVSHP